MSRSHGHVLWRRQSENSTGIKYRLAHGERIVRHVVNGGITYSALSHSMYDTHPREMTKKNESRESKSQFAFGS
jgi:hypothetical protein